jgi:hypothetical protein
MFASRERSEVRGTRRVIMGENQNNGMNNE